MADMHREAEGVVDEQAERDGENALRVLSAAMDGNEFALEAEA